MNARKFIFKYMWLVVATLLVCEPAPAEEDTGDGEHEDEVKSLVMNEAEREAAGIETSSVARRQLFEILRLPGEVIPNAYRSAKVAPRITAQILKRHVLLGDQVQAGQHMVTLSSVDMADAQGGLLVADQEWRRVKALGKDVVSARRYTEAQVERQQAMAKVLAYGMTEAQADRLLAPGNASRATGAFDLLAPIAGTVLLDNFVVGELIEPGRVIFEISDETTLWIEARTSASKIAGVSIGMAVRISPDRTQWSEATVVQIHHRLDEVTRTQAIRVEFDNTNDRLHPGQFVEVEIAVGTSQDVLAVPTDSVVLLKGDTVVFRLTENNEFHPEAVTVGATFSEWSEVVSGLAEGDVIATAGTFFLKSMVLKSELGEGHAH